ncbi:MAG: hypothetical protein DWQ34_12805 [Planctomycetota bacterium]|nr:MAG: hypothetical protein DWQ34_12805 [Planctomycetota bacterium]REK24103.1 MAG: hypothetical protein DWQ41_13715 [Planctomycetota bacterium]REK38319.1 MAG: hypothetical protein DWQ45_04930 [Planctomycetota bacterium]
MTDAARGGLTEWTDESTDAETASKAALPETAWSARVGTDGCDSASTGVKRGDSAALPADWDAPPVGSRDRLPRRPGIHRGLRLHDLDRRRPSGGQGS